MSIFEPSTSVEESPEIGQEEAMPEEQQLDTGADNQEQPGPQESQEEAAESPSEESEQGDKTQDYVPANTYNELRGAFTRKAQEVAELKRQLGQRQQPPAPAGQGQPAEPQNMAEFQQSLNQKVATMREEGYHEAIIDLVVKADTATFKSTMLERRLDASLNQQTFEKDRTHVQSILKKLEADYPDLATGEGRDMILNKMMEIAQEMGAPQILARPSERILKLAANEIWGDGKAAIYTKAKEKGKAEALETIKAKQGVTTTVTKKQAEVTKTPEESIADSIVSAGRRPGIFG